MRIFKGIQKFTIFSMLLAFIAFAEQQESKEKAVSQPVDTNVQVKKAAVKTPDKQILFFMNPNGRPCQMQMSIIENMKSKLEGVTTVTFVKTTEPSDESKFYQYGIRGLPSLIIADKNGKEIKRLPPGIKDEKTILDALK